MPVMPCEIKVSLFFSLRPDSKVPNTAREDAFFAMIVIEGNKLLMSDLFRVYDPRMVVSVEIVVTSVLMFLATFRKIIVTI